MTRPIVDEGASSSVSSGTGGLLIGTGAPTSAVGEDGNLYLDKATNKLYSRSLGIWSFETELGGGGDAAALIAGHVADASDPHAAAGYLDHLVAPVDLPVGENYTSSITWTAPFNARLVAIYRTPIVQVASGVTAQVVKDPGGTPVDMLASSSESLDGGTVDLPAAVSLASGAALEVDEGVAVRTVVTCSGSATGKVLQLQARWERR